MSHQKNDDNKNLNNSKKVICYNMLNNKKCNYGNKCMYAHSLNEQKIIPLRHKAYTIIKSVDNLNNINLVLDHKLYEMLLQLTKICAACSKDLCPGGYNCRYGAVNSKCRVCYEDLVYGNCKKHLCPSIHLTERGLVPYLKQKNKDKVTEKSSPSSDENNSDNRKKYNKRPYDNKVKKELDNVQGVLLTEKFILTHFGKLSGTVSEADSDSELNEDVDKMIKYLHDDNDNSDDESIFLI
jgi:hypothetical protein